MQALSLDRTVKIILLLFLVFAGLIYSRDFLVPIAFAGLLAMLFRPLARKIESKTNRGIGALVCVLIIIAAIIGMVALLWWQLSDLLSDTSAIERKFGDMVRDFRYWISKNFGISPKKQQEIMEPGGQSQGTSILASIAAAITGSLVDFLLVLVYIFLFLYFRTHIKKFILMLVPAGERKHTQQVLEEIQKVSQQYLGGMGMMIVGLWIMYGIGFSIVGVENALFFAVLCGLLEIIPFVGNLTGNLITIVMAIGQGGDVNMVVGILIVYAIVQFIQSYILEPLVVGSEVNINPLFTIMILVLGELVWGIPGMVLSIPLLGIFKIICDHVEPLKPYGFLIGEEKKKSAGLIERMKSIFKRKK